MHDVRDRSHRLNRVDGIARHGRLPRSGPFRTVAALVASVAAVAVVSTASVAAIAAKQVTDDLGDGVQIEGQPAPRSNGTKAPSLSAYKGGFNMLVVGTDNDPDQSAEFGERDATLNDVNILLHVSADHTNATAVSIPATSSPRSPRARRPTAPGRRRRWPPNPSTPRSATVGSTA